MKPDDVANAITQALVQGGAQWLVAHHCRLPARPVDDDADSAPGSSLCAAHAAALRPAAGRRHLVDVVPADARRRAARSPLP